MESQGSDCHSPTKGHVLTTTCWKAKVAWKDKTNSTYGVYIIQYINNLEFGKYIKDIK
jgi:hypothetical protein